jgi:hypothetical protein
MTLAGSEPGKVQAIAIMTLVGGIWAVLWGIGVICGAWWLVVPILTGAYSIVFGVLAIIKGASLLGQAARNETAPRPVAIMQIVNVINCDIANMVLGIITLVFLSDEQVASYYQP